MPRKKKEAVKEAVIEPSQELVPVADLPATKKDLENMLHLQQSIAPRLTPNEIVAEAHERATLLVKIVEQCGLTKVLGRDTNRKFLMVEGWQTLAQFYDLTAESGEVEAIEMHGVKGFKARAIVRRMSTGEEIGCAEAFVMDDERNWKGRDIYAKCSMAQTRAVSKALRLKCSWVAVLAGFSATPAEEIPDDEIKPEPKAPKRASESRPAAPSKSEAVTPQQAAEILDAEIIKPEGEKYISEAQRRMFFAVMSDSHRTNEQGKAYLASIGIDSTKHILKKDFEGILTWAKSENEVKVPA